MIGSSSKDEIFNLFPSQDPLILAIDSMWKSKSRRVFIRSIEYVIQVIQSALEKNDTPSRSFRFGVNRLSQLIDAGLFDIAGDEANGTMHLKIVCVMPRSTSACAPSYLAMRITERNMVSQNCLN